MAPPRAKIIQLVRTALSERLRCNVRVVQDADGTVIVHVLDILKLCGKPLDQSQALRDGLKEHAVKLEGMLGNRPTKGVRGSDLWLPLPLAILIIGKKGGTLTMSSKPQLCMDLSRGAVFECDGSDDPWSDVDIDEVFEVGDEAEVTPTPRPATAPGSRGISKGSASVENSVVHARNLPVWKAIRSAHIPAAQGGALEDSQVDMFTPPQHTFEFDAPPQPGTFSLLIILTAQYFLSPHLCFRVSPAHLSRACLTVFQSHGQIFNVRNQQRCTCKSPSTLAVYEEWNSATRTLTNISWPAFGLWCRSILSISPLHLNRCDY
jgi:hypothetical protein